MSEPKRGRRTVTVKQARKMPSERERFKRGRREQEEAMERVSKPWDGPQHLNPVLPPTE